jgi:hypothetical protein
VKLEGDLDVGKKAVAATLYAKIPFIGRVKLAGVSGDLVKGIQASINVVVASGSITLKLQNSTDVVATIKAHVQWVGDFDQTFKLFTYVLCFCSVNKLAKGLFLQHLRPRTLSDGVLPSSSVLAPTSVISLRL